MQAIEVGARSVLVLGGARSGKSSFAQSLAEAAAPDRLYVATAAAHDEEMAERIARHQRDRGAGWTTLEAPLDLAGALAAEARPGRVVVVDCLTLWLTNVMLSGDHAPSGRDVEAEAARLADAVGALAGPAIFVSNEVGSGIVPATPLGRAFRDAQGRTNAAIARACDAVVLVTAGLPTLLKPAPALAWRLR